MKRILFLICMLLGRTIMAQTGPIAPTTPLVWNSFDSYGVYLHEKAAFENLDAFDKKLKLYGYEYFVIDAGWWGEYKLIPVTIYPAEKHASNVALDEYGRVEPSRVYFPNGFKPLIDRANQLGVKFGVHLMRGIPRKTVKMNLPVLGTNYHARDNADTTSICTWNPQNYGVDMNKPGVQEYYNSIYRKLAEWGVDFVKVDDLIPYPKEIIAIGKAVRNSGRPIVYSLSPGGNSNLKDLPYYTVANMVRITSDIWDDQNSIDWSFSTWRTWQGKGRSGFWPDLDMIPFGNLQLMKPEPVVKQGENVLLSGKGRISQFTKPKMRTFITQRALAASPIMVGGDLPRMDEYSLSLLTNRDMLACNQNGHTVSLIREEDGLEMWSTSVSNNQLKGWLGYFNRSGDEREVMLDRKELKLVKHPLR